MIGVFPRKCDVRDSVKPLPVELPNHNQNNYPEILIHQITISTSATVPQVGGRVDLAGYTR
jgi:hypothetical protein